MSQDPFKIIKPTDEAPKELRDEVMSSVKLIILVMRFSQLFLADYAYVLFDKFRVLTGSSKKRKKKYPN